MLLYADVTRRGEIVFKFNQLTIFVLTLRGCHYVSYLFNPKGVLCQFLSGNRSRNVEIRIAADFLVTFFITCCINHKSNRSQVERFIGCILITICHFMNVLYGKTD